MTANKPGSIRRALTEFVVIVVGVLVALWIDAGWSWLQDREQEQTLLRDLHADFHANLESVREVAAAREAAVELGTRLLRGGVDAFPADSLDIVALHIFSHWTLNPRTGALESALSTGRIDRLRSDELRSLLAAWPGSLSDAEEEALSMVPSMVQVYISTTADYLRGVESRQILRRVMQDPVLAGTIATKVMAHSQTRGEMENLMSLTERVVALLVAEIDGPS